MKLQCFRQKCHLREASMYGRGLGLSKFELVTEFWLWFYHIFIISYHIIFIHIFICHIFCAQNSLFLSLNTKQLFPMMRKYLNFLFLFFFFTFLFLKHRLVNLRSEFHGVKGVLNFWDVVTPFSGRNMSPEIVKICPNMKFNSFYWP